VTPNRPLLLALCGLGTGLVTASATAQTGATQTGATQTAATQPSARVEVTNANSIVYNADNRNSRPGDVSRALDDEWGALFNRLNVQTTYGNWRLAARVDTGWFYTSRSPTNVGLSLLEQSRGDANPPYSTSDADFFVNKFFEAGTDRNTRFTDWTYPAKYTLTYATPDVEATAGDFYAQFGRGLVLSIRKQDELSSDTTVRGVRLSGQTRLDKVRFKLTALGGNVNPLRVDSSSGRFLGVPASGRGNLATATEFLMPHVVSNDFVPAPRPTYLPDTVYGGQLEVKHPYAQLSLHGVGIERGCIDTTDGCVPLSADFSRSARRIQQGAVAVEFPNIATVGSAYIEYARQSLVFGGTNADHTGDALYATASFARSPLATTVEAKHVRGYQTVAAGVDTGRAPEFSPIVYNLVPTTHPVWNDTQFENFGTCVTGGRVRNDLTLLPGFGWFASVGYYHTYGEVGPAACAPTRANLNRVWDITQGLETSSQGGKSTSQVLFGTRTDDTAVPHVDDSGRASTNYYREVYVRYDVVRSIGGQSSIQLQGWHRRRHQLLGGPDHPWLQGITTTALQLGATWNLALGVEYDQNPAFPGTYFSGQVRYNINPSNNVTLFVGQQRGGLRCVSGVCRVFPPFEGAKLESTLRF
jgi:hypothetical protein